MHSIQERSDFLSAIDVPRTLRLTYGQPLHSLNSASHCIVDVFAQKELKPKALQMSRSCSRTANIEVLSKLLEHARRSHLSLKDFLCWHLLVLATHATLLPWIQTPRDTLGL
eukprot:1715808-Amphidinium_carterae.2